MARPARPRRRVCWSNPARGRSDGRPSAARATSSRRRSRRCSTRSNTRTTRGPRRKAPRTLRLRLEFAGAQDLTSTRASARQAIPDELRRDVRMLGEQLGRVIKDYGGAGLLKDVETLRRSVIRARDADEHERKTENIVAGWSLKRAELVAHAFTCYFHLVNLAEEHHRARVLRESGGGTAPMRESLAATVPELRRRLGRRRLIEILAGLEIHPVFTAHPTEARRRAVVAASRCDGSPRRSTRSGEPGSCAPRRSLPWTRSVLRWLSSTKRCFASCPRCIAGWIGRLALLTAARALHSRPRSSASAAGLEAIAMATTASRRK